MGEVSLTSKKEMCGTEDERERLRGQVDVPEDELLLLKGCCNRQQRHEFVAISLPDSGSRQNGAQMKKRITSAQQA